MLTGERQDLDVDSLSSSLICVMRQNGVNMPSRCSGKRTPWKKAKPEGKQEATKHSADSLGLQTVMVVRIPEEKEEEPHQRQKLNLGDPQRGKCHGIPSDAFSGKFH